MRQPKKQTKSFSITDEVNESSKVKKFSNKEESKIAKSINASTTIQSGAYIFDPADVRLDDFVIEVKSAKTAKQIIVTEKILDKILNESARVGKNPMVMLNFPNTKLRKKKWVVVPYEE
jgi:hypothetical protein